jgi:hypothetical protein
MAPIHASPRGGERAADGIWAWPSCVELCLSPAPVPPRVQCTLVVSIGPKPTGRACHSEATTRPKTRNRVCHSEATESVTAKPHGDRLCDGSTVARCIVDRGVQVRPSERVPGRRRTLHADCDDELRCVALSGPHLDEMLQPQGRNAKSRGAIVLSASLRTR